MRKKILIPILLLLAVVLGFFVSRFVLWSRFDPTPVIGSSVSCDTADITVAATQWFDTYFLHYSGHSVPPWYRVRDARITEMEDLDNGFVQIDYSLYVFLPSSRLVGDLGAYPTDDPRIYEDQMVLQFERDGALWTVTDKMRPAAWQIAYLPEIQEEREKQIDHYKMDTSKEYTYYILDETLYVSYNAGETLVEVPGGYARVCVDPNGRYHEALPDNSYLISPEFTAFIGFHSGLSAYLYYSTDSGQTWEEQLICDYAYYANSFLSLTESGIYATVATDRGLGSDYYSIFFSSDFVNWTSIPLSGTTRNFTCVYWPTDGVGYFSCNSVVETLETQPDGTTQKIMEDNCFSYTPDNGETYQMLRYPVEQFIDELGYNPFDTLEAMYQEDGVLYMIVGQGDDGDYAEDGIHVSALYQSTDGVNFTFVETIDHTRTLAG